MITCRTKSSHNSYVNRQRQYNTTVEPVNKMPLDLARKLGKVKVVKAVTLVPKAENLTELFGD